MYFVPTKNWGARAGLEARSRLFWGKQRYCLLFGQRYCHFSDKEFHGAEMKLPTSTWRKSMSEIYYYHYNFLGAVGWLFSTNFHRISGWKSVIWKSSISEIAQCFSSRLQFHGFDSSKCNIVALWQQKCLNLGFLQI